MPRSPASLSYSLLLADVGSRGPAPEAVAHTFDALAEPGTCEEELARLALDGAIG